MDNAEKVLLTFFLKKAAVAGLIQGLRYFATHYHPKNGR